MRIFVQDQENQGITQNRTYSTPHLSACLPERGRSQAGNAQAGKQSRRFISLWLINAEIAQKGHLWMETS